MSLKGKKSGKLGTLLLNSFQFDDFFLTASSKAIAVLGVAVLVLLAILSILDL